MIVLPSPKGILGRRRRRRRYSPEEWAAEVERTRVEVEAIAIINEHHALLPRSAAEATGAIYARFSTKLQKSIPDQVRAMFGIAVAEKIFVPREHVLYDMGVRGCQRRRPGFEELSAALSARRINTLIVFSTNRLHRKAYRSLQFVEEEIVEKRLRCLFVAQKIDTADQRKWKAVLQMYMLLDELSAEMYSEHIKASLIGLFLRGYVHGVLPLSIARLLLNVAVHVLTSRTPVLLDWFIF